MIVNRHRYVALVLVIAFSCSFAVEGLLSFINLNAIGNTGTSSGNLFNNTTNSTKPVASDTKNPSHNWKGIVALNSWWNTAWAYRQMVNFTEPGLMDRINDPENVYMTFSAGLAHNNSIRVACFNSSSNSWNEIPSQVYNATLSGAFYTRCTIFFFLNITKGTMETYYVYYDPVINSRYLAGTDTVFVDHIYLRGYTENVANIPADTTNPSFNSFYINGSNWNTNKLVAFSHVTSIQIIVNNNTVTPRAKICLVDTVRAGSDWGGPCNSIYSATQGATDALNIGATNHEWESIGELALQAANDSGTDPMGQGERINVGPDGVQEAWGPLPAGQNGAITVLDDGPLFCRFNIRTTDGAYSAPVAIGTAWAAGGYDDAIYGTVADSVNRGADGGLGYVKYNITYTFYYQQANSTQTFSRIDLNIGAFPQRGANSTYPVQNARYIHNTGVCFKNYGDWPHIMQLVATNTTNIAQDSKSWNGSKYGLYTMNIAARKCDYPLEPWTCWWSSTTDAIHAPSIGLMAITNSIGWQVLSLAVGGIGPNSLLQQILPEGWMGGLYQVPNNFILSWTYYTMTSPYGSNYGNVRDMSRRLNKPVTISTFGSTETYIKNQVWVHTNDKLGNLARGVQVTLKNATGFFKTQYVNSTGWASFLQVSDGTYTVQVNMLTNNFKTNYTVYSAPQVLNHATNRYYYIMVTCNMANLTLKVVNWAKSNQLLTGVQVSFINTTSLAIMEQNYTWNGFMSFRLFTTGATTYNIQMIYGGTTCIENFTNPYMLNATTGDKQLNVGLDIQTTAITMNTQPPSVTFGGNYTVSFYMNNFGDTTTKYRPSSIIVSNLYGSGYWPGGTGGMYNWSVGVGNLISLTLATGVSKWLNTTGTIAVFIHAINATVLPAEQQIYIVINSIPTSIKFTLNNTVSNSISVSRGSTVQLKVAYLNGVTPIQVTTAANMNYTLGASTTTIPWVPANNNYTVPISTTTLTSGTYVITVNAYQQNYAKVVTSFVIIVSLRAATISPSSPGIIYYGTTFSIPFTLNDGVNGTGISTISSRLDANVKNYPAINELSITGTAGNYQINYNSTSFPALGSYFIYINWTAPVLYPYYQNCYSSITIVISQRLSQLTYVPVGNVAYGENVSISIQFTDGVNSTTINPSHTTINCNVTAGLGFTVNAAKNLVTFRSKDLGGSLGTFYANVSASYNQLFAPYYRSQWVNVKVIVVNRPTQLIATSPAEVQYRQNATFSVVFSDLMNSSRIYGATKVSITVNKTFGVTLQGDNSYLITINSSYFGNVGSYNVLVTSTWIGGAPFYSSNTVVVKVMIVQRSTQISYDSLAPTAFRDNFTFFMNFQDGINSNPIGGATIITNLANPTHITVSMVSAGRYSISLNTTEVRSNPGSSSVIFYVNIVSASPNYYSSGQITILLTVTQRPITLAYTSLQSTPFNQPVNFNIVVTDAENGSALRRAAVVSTPQSGITLGSSPLGNSVYAITLTNTGLLTIGSHSIVFNVNFTTSLSPYYKNNTITITVQITARSTQIIYSGVVPTSYGTGSLFDFTIQVQDAITSSSITLIPAGSFHSNSSTFTMYSESPLGTYHVRISTTERGNIGTFKYWINAVPGGNYASTNITIPFTVTNRAISLSPLSVSATYFGQNVMFNIQYSDGINGTGLPGHNGYFTNNRTSGNPATVLSIGSGTYNVTIPASQFAALGSYAIRINATWPASAPFYAFATIVVPFTIVNRASTLTASKESNPQFGDNMTIDIAFQDGINNNYININRVTQLSVSVAGGYNGSVAMWRSGTNGQYQVKISTFPLPSIGTYTINIIASWSGSPFYATQSQSVSVTVTQRNAILNPGSEIYTTYAYNVNFNVSLYYQDVINGSTIIKTSAITKKVTANHLGTNVPTVNTTSAPITYYAGVGWKIAFNSANFITPGFTYTVVVQINWSTSVKPFYINNTISFSITVSVASTQLVEVGSYTAQSNQNQTLFFEYINSQSGSPIGGATIAVNKTHATGTMWKIGSAVIWNGTAYHNATTTYYKLVFNSTALGGTGLHPFNITFSETNYNTATFAFTLVNTALGSQLTLVSVQSNRILGQTISMEVFYKYQGSSTGITKASLNISNDVSSLYWGYLTEYSYTDLGNAHYNLTVLNTGTSAPRINTTQFYNVYIQAYTSTTTLQTINVQFQMLQIPANISKVFFNSTDSTSNPSYTTQITKKINITVQYDLLFPSVQHITSGATVSLSGSGLPSTQYFSLVGSKYSLILPASELGVGTQFLFVTAQKGNYQQSSKSLQITITQVATNLTLYLNGTQRSSIQVSYGQFVNVSALYKNTVDNVYIKDVAASVTLTGGSHGTPYPLAAVGNTWEMPGPQFAINSGLLGVPASYTMTLSASRANYTTSSTVFTITVVQVPTTLDSASGNRSFSVYWSSTFTIGLTYLDNASAPILGAHLTSNPNVNASGATFTSPNYYLQYSASQFGAPQIYNLIITIVKGNYTSQSITFSININAIPTTLNSFKSGGGASTYFVVNWSNSINIVMQFHNTLLASSIAGATISAGAKNSSITSVSYANGNYTLKFSSTILGDPNVYPISLTFSKTDYATAIVAITIQVSGPGTGLIVSTPTGQNTTQFTITYGQPLVFGVRMRDLNHSIFLASWASSESLAPTSDVNNGIYHNVTYAGLSLIPGLYTITITGTKTNYTSASTTITVIVNTIPTRLSTYILNGGLSSLFSVEWGLTLSVSVQYYDTLNHLALSPALEVITTSARNKLSGIPANNSQNCTFTFDGSKFVPGVYTIIFSASRQYYNSNSTSITLTVNAMATTLQTYNSTTHAQASTFTAIWGKKASFDISYNQTSTLNSFALIPGVIVTAPAWTGYPSIVADNGRLNASFDTSRFAPGVLSITITAQYANRTSQSIVVSLTITPVSTQIFTYNSTNQIATTYNVYWNQPLSIDLLYQTTTGTSLTTSKGTTVISSPYTPVSQVNSTHVGRLNLTFSTSSFAIQIYQITFTASLANYTTASISVLVNMMQRPSSVKVYNTAYVENYSYNVFWGDTLSVNVLYADSLNSTSLSNKLGTSIISSLTSTNSTNIPYLSLSFSTASLTPNLYSIVISCNRNKFSSAQTVILLNVLFVPTSVATFNGTTSATSFKATWNTMFSISLQFNRTYLPASISGAIIVANPVNVSWSIASGKYVLIFNSSKIGIPGIYSITITASKANFVTSAISVTLQVLTVNTVLQSYVQGGNLQSQFTIEWGKVLTFTTRYQLAAAPFTALHPTNVTKANFPGTITLGSGSNQNITMVVNGSAFSGTGIFTPTFIMSRTNYTQDSLLVTIQVVSLQTLVNLFVNSTSNSTFTDITASRQYPVPFENYITIRVQYLTVTGSKPINNAFISIRFLEKNNTVWINYPGVNDTIMNRSNGIYDLKLNTLSDLGDFGQYSFVVVISKANYTLESQTFYVYPLKKQTRLDIFDSRWNLITNGQKFTINYTQTLVLYSALYDLSKHVYINTTYAPTYTAVLKLTTFSPTLMFPNGTARFVFNTTRLNIDVGTSNFISFTGSSAIYNPSGGSVNMEVDLVPTNIKVFNAMGAQVGAGSTISLNYTKQFALNVTYTDTLNNSNIINFAGASVVAKIYATTIPATYVGNGKWHLVFDSMTLPITAGSTPQVLIQASYTNYTVQVFSFNLALLTVPTTLTVLRDNGGGILTLIMASITVNWSDTLTLRVWFNDTLNHVPIGSYSNPPSILVTFGISPTYTVSGSTTILGYTNVVIDCSLLTGGNTYNIIVTGNMLNYTGSEFRFNLVVLNLPTKLLAMNATTHFSEGQTLKVYYGDTLGLNVSYEETLPYFPYNENISVAGPDIHAVVSGITIYAVNQFNGNWTILINTGSISGLGSGSQLQIIITASYLNRSQAVFSFYMQVLEIPTGLVIPRAIQSVVHYTWGQSFNFEVRYSDIHNNVPINGSMISNYPTTSIVYIGATSNYTITFNTIMIGSPGIYRITLTASKVNYAPASYTITVQIGEVPTSLQVLFNGKSFLTITLKQTIMVTINYSRADNGLPVQGALVYLNFTNDLNSTLVGYSTTTGQIHYNSVLGIYWVGITLDLKTFFAQPKFVIVQAYLANYTIGKANPVINLQPVEILPHQNLPNSNPSDMNIHELAPATVYTFDFQLFDNSTGSGFADTNEISVNITCSAMNIINAPMKNIGNGTFEYNLPIPSNYNATYVVIVDVLVGNSTLARQFHIQNEYTYHLSTELAPPTQNLMWLVMAMLVGIIVLVAWFILYQVRLKYPPIIRKIHDLQRSVRRGKAAAKIATQKVSTREEGIYSEFAKILNEYSFLQTRAKSMAASAKKAKAEKGYVEPSEKDTLAKEFDLSTTEKVVEIKSVAPSIMQKEGPKKYVEPPTAPAPVELPTMPKLPTVAPAKPGAARPAGPKIPATVKPGALKPPALAALPKPAARPVVPQPGAIPSEGEGQEGLYGELVKLEQKKYKAQRSVRDLKAKKDKGILTDEEYKQYESKFEEALEKINEKISEIRRKLVNF